MKQFQYKTIVLLVLSLPLFIVSCEEDKTSGTEIPDQLFRPVNFAAGINGNKVSFTWVPIANASYLLEISRDSLLFERDFQTFEIDEAVDFEVEDLWSQEKYSARIKSVSKTAGIKDSEFKQITFTTGTENIFYSVADEDIGTDHIQLSWDASKSVSRIVVSDITNIELTDSEMQAGVKNITGLTPGTLYTFRIYYGEMLRGTVSATTLAK